MDICADRCCACRSAGSGLAVKVLSTNTGRPQAYTFQDLTVRSSMRRESVPTGIQVRFKGVDGDEFSSPLLHGVNASAVYAYSAATFPQWTVRYEQKVGAGNFGENLTVDELDESHFFAGDEWTVGTARLRVSGPRYPCNRLNACFQRADAMSVFTEVRRPGVYFEVVGEGFIRPGDELVLARRSGQRWSVIQIFDLLTARKILPYGDDVRAAFSAIAIDADVPDLFRTQFQKALAASR